MDLPGYGTIQGSWDLRGKEMEYLGHINLRGCKVLEFGTASGHLCFYMERQGAQVVCYDLSGRHEWDIVPYAGLNLEKTARLQRAHLQKLNNSYWFAHRHLKSRARVVYGSIYGIPENIGTYDAGIFGSILLHLRDPFLALAKASRHVRWQMVVTDVLHERLDNASAVMEFIPKTNPPSAYDTWWRLTPEVVAAFLRVLGFDRSVVRYHTQTQWRDNQQKTYNHFTLVAQRTPTAQYIQSRVRRLWADLGKRRGRKGRFRVAIYGCGSHTAWMEKVVRDLKGPKIEALLDNQASGKGTFWGLRPVSPESWDPAKVDAIILSSDTCSEQLRANSMKIFGRKLTIVDLYKGLPPGPYPKAG